MRTTLTGDEQGLQNACGQELQNEGEFEHGNGVPVRKERKEEEPSVGMAPGGMPLSIVVGGDGA